MILMSQKHKVYLNVMQNPKKTLHNAFQEEKGCRLATGGHEVAKQNSQSSMCAVSQTSRKGLAKTSSWVLLLLLHSQLYLWGSPVLVRFLPMWPFSNPTIEVVTFRLHGWCMLGVFLLPALTRLGHECKDLLSPFDEMHVCSAQTTPQFILSSERVLGNGVRTHVNLKG